MSLFLSLLFYFFLIRSAVFFTAVNFTWVIGFLDVLIVLILLLPKASRTLVEGIIMCPERVVVGSSTITSAITGLAPRAAPYTLLRRIAVIEGSFRMFKDVGGSLNQYISVSESIWPK